MSHDVRRVPASLTYSLRRQVLRPQQTLQQMRLAGDDEPDTGCFAVTDPDGTVVGSATVRREACPWEPERTGAWRLRGMATEPGRQGQGIGTAVLAAALAHVAGLGGGLLWCNARTPARAFYESAGFAVQGDDWVDPVIGPHVHMWREVGQASA